MRIPGSHTRSGRICSRALRARSAVGRSPERGRDALHRGHRVTDPGYRRRGICHSSASGRMPRSSALPVLRRGPPVGRRGPRTRVWPRPFPDLSLASWCCKKARKSAAADRRQRGSPVAKLQGHRRPGAERRWPTADAHLHGPRAAGVDCIFQNLLERLLQARPIDRADRLHLGAVLPECVADR